MILKDREVELLEECLEVFENTHSYDTDIYSDVKLAINALEWDNPKYLLKECKFFLSDTHCYNMGIYQRLEEYLDSDERS